MSFWIVYSSRSSLYVIPAPSFSLHDIVFCWLFGPRNPFVLSPLFLLLFNKEEEQQQDICLISSSSLPLLWSIVAADFTEIVSHKNQEDGCCCSGDKTGRRRLKENWKRTITDTGGWRVVGSPKRMFFFSPFRQWFCNKQCRPIVSRAP